ncbi:aldehyde dehydrogenase family protein [Streptomyces sp. NPDC002476]|uniref:aldehyde dehydrogenase family protein n=1 Tax=Streptomyces sp. NPDC002476 TaxID=3364648 RepID=UPI00367E044D
MDRIVPGTVVMDEAVHALRRHARSWAATPLEERIALLERLVPRILGVASDMVAVAARAKGYAPDSPWAAEDWAGGPWALLQGVNSRLEVLRRIAKGRDPVESHAVRIRDGRIAVDVFPATGWDRVLLNGHRAEVRMQEGATPESVRAGAAKEYRGGASPPGVALVLGGGNVASVTALDVLHKLYTDGQVAVAKTHPVNAYLRPHLEQIFSEFVKRDWLRFVDGGEAEGAYLTTHPGADSIHVTGSDRTHDAIVWGTDGLAEQRRRENTPLVTKPFTSELGGVSPVIVVPGDWSDTDFRFQAEHIVTSKMNNSGHNCVASQVLIVPSGWTGSQRLLDEIRLLARALPTRAGYYPGTENRLAEVLARHPEAEILGTTGLVLVPELHDHDDPLITAEVFAGALGVVKLPGDSPREFLRRAIDFANYVLPGTLGATVLVHPRTEKAASPAVRDAVAALRYGTLGVNCWPGVGFLLGYTPWGAYPGHTRQAVGSGTGFVHNAFMLGEIEKTVLRAPFAPAPRGLFAGSPSLSPRPPYFATSRTGRVTLERLTHFVAAPRARSLPALVFSALRS